MRLLFNSTKIEVADTQISLNTTPEKKLIRNHINLEFSFLTIQEVDEGSVPILTADQI